MEASKKTKRAPLTEEEKASPESIRSVIDEFDIPVPATYIATRLGKSKRAVNSALHENQDIFRTYKLKHEGKVRSVLWGLHK